MGEESIKTVDWQPLLIIGQWLLHKMWFHLSHLSN